MNLIQIQMDALESGHVYFTKWQRFSSRQKVHHMREAYDEREPDRDQRELPDRERNELRERDYFEEIDLAPESRYPDRYGWDQYDYRG